MTSFEVGHYGTVSGQSRPVPWQFVVRKAGHHGTHPFRGVPLSRPPMRAQKKYPTSNLLGPSRCVCGAGGTDPDIFFARNKFK